MMGKKNKVVIFFVLYICFGKKHCMKRGLNNVCPHCPESVVLIIHRRSDSEKTEPTLKKKKQKNNQQTNTIIGAVLPPSQYACSFSAAHFSS